MKIFKKFIDDLREESEEEVPVEFDSSSTENNNLEDLNILRSWIKYGEDWLFEFSVNGIKYSVLFTPIDKEKKHWKFSYFKIGQKESSNIKKFGNISDWVDIWNVILNILEEFITKIKPNTIKYIGMSVSKREYFFREFFKIYKNNFKDYFTKINYNTTFDRGNIDLSPTFVIKRWQQQEIEGPSENYGKK